MSRKLFDEPEELEQDEFDEDAEYVNETSGFFDEEDDEQALWDGDELVSDPEIDEDEVY